MKIIVALDMTYMDQLLISYAGFMEDFLAEDSLELIFYHNIHFEQPDKMQVTLNSLETPLSEILGERMTQLVEAYKFKSQVSFHIDESEDTAEAILAFQKRIGAEAVLFAKKVSYDGSGYLIERVMHKNPSADIWVIPETSNHQLNHGLVPIDFSKKSARAFQKGLSLGEKYSLDLSCLHIYSIPKIYFPYIPVGKLDREVEEEAKKEWVQFNKKYNKANQKIEIDYLFDTDRTVAQLIYNYGLKNQMSLIILPKETSLVTSTVIQLLKRDLNVPLLIV